MFSMDSCNISGDPFLENLDIEILPGTKNVLDTLDLIDTARSVSPSIKVHLIPRTRSSFGTMLFRITFSSPLKDQNCIC